MLTTIPETKLPDGTQIFCLQEEEVPVLYEQVQDYVKYGIKLHEGDVVFDVGANIGLFSLWTYRECDRNVNIYAFEPIPAIFEVLQANANRFDAEKIKVFPCGLSQESKETKFAYHPDATMLSTAYQDDASELRNQIKQAILRNIKDAPKSYGWLRLLRWVPTFVRSRLIEGELNSVFETEQVTCQLKTISEILQEQKIDRVDLLKIDVEKSEFDVLLGIQPQDWQKIEQIVVEVHNIEHRLKKITALLKEQGFTKIKVAQRTMFRGSNLFNLYARRS